MAIEFSYKGYCENFTISQGSYLFELWGAQGGNCTFIESGRGGYARAKIVLRHSQLFFVCVGGEGSYSYSEIVEGGFNGGGRNGISPHVNESCGGSGGGATDIRISGHSLEDRVLVAGGGGGASTYYYNSVLQRYKLGGYGGGIEGGKSSGAWDYYQNGNGGNQTHGGQGGYYISGDQHPSCSGTNGAIGIGGYGEVSAWSGAGGGGGGFYCG